MPRRRKPQLRIGTSGYQYDHWRGIFYPEGLPKRRWFEFYASEFATVEINNSFYRLPEGHTFAAWREQAPPGFCYAVKYSRYATHLKRLRDPEQPLGRFLPRVAELGETLGPVLVQLPPNLGLDEERLEAFLQAAPAWVRWTIEFRHPSWLIPATYQVLRRHGAALCMHDKIAQHPDLATTDWVYYRFHGAAPEGHYGRQRLEAKAQAMAEHLRLGRDVYAYFNNDWGGHAISDARELRQLLGQRLKFAA